MCAKVLRKINEGVSAKTQQYSMMGNRRKALHARWLEWRKVTKRRNNVRWVYKMLTCARVAVSLCVSWVCAPPLTPTHTHTHAHRVSYYCWTPSQPERLSQGSSNWFVCLMGLCNPPPSTHTHTIHSLTHTHTHTHTELLVFNAQPTGTVFWRWHTASLRSDAPWRLNFCLSYFLSSSASLMRQTTCSSYPSLRYTHIAGTLSNQPTNNRSPQFCWGSAQPHKIYRPIMTL